MLILILRERNSDDRIWIQTGNNLFFIKPSSRMDGNYNCWRREASSGFKSVCKLTRPINYSQWPDTLSTKQYISCDIMASRPTCHLIYCNWYSVVVKTRIIFVELCNKSLPPPPLTPPRNIRLMVQVYWKERQLHKLCCLLS